MSVPPESLNADSLTAREHADAQLQDPNLTLSERRAAWIYRCSLKPSDAHDGVAFFDEAV